MLHKLFTCPSYLCTSNYYYAASLSLEAHRAIVIKLSRERSVGRSVCRSVRTSVCPVHCGKGGSDPDAIWHHRSDGSRDETGIGVWGSFHVKGYFGANLGCAIVTNGDFTAYVCDSASTVVAAV